MNNSYLLGKLEIKTKIIDLLKKDYEELQKQTKKFFSNPIKKIKIKSRIKVEEELLNLNRKTKFIYQSINSKKTKEE